MGEEGMCQISRLVPGPGLDPKARTRSICFFFNGSVVKRVKIEKRRSFDVLGDVVLYVNQNHEGTKNLQLDFFLADIILIVFFLYFIKV